MVYEEKNNGNNERETIGERRERITRRRRDLKARMKPGLTKIEAIVNEF
jgi:hypothetical protein